MEKNNSVTTLMGKNKRDRPTEQLPGKGRKKALQRPGAHVDKEKTHTALKRPTEGRAEGEGGEDCEPAQDTLPKESWEGKESKNGISYQKPQDLEVKGAASSGKEVRALLSRSRFPDRTLRRTANKGWRKRGPRFGK